MNKITRTHFSSTKTPWSLSEAEKIGESIIEELSKYLHRAILAGSIRRQSPRINDIDILIVPKYPKRLEKYLENTYGNVIGLGGKWLLKYQYGNNFINLFKTTHESWGASLLQTTGSSEFNIKMRAHAKSLGYKLNQYGLYNKNKIIVSEKEGDIFDKLNVEFIIPENRTPKVKFKIKAADIEYTIMYKNEPYYQVTYNGRRWHCTCKGFLYRRYCRHVTYCTNLYEDGITDIAIDKLDIPKPREY